MVQPIQTIIMKPSIELKVSNKLVAYLERNFVPVVLKRTPLTSQNNYEALAFIQIKTLYSQSFGYG